MRFYLKSLIKETVGYFVLDCSDKTFKGVSEQIITPFKFIFWNINFGDNKITNKKLCEKIISQTLARNFLGLAYIEFRNINFN